MMFGSSLSCVLRTALRCESQLLKTAPRLIFCSVNSFSSHGNKALNSSDGLPAVTQNLFNARSSLKSVGIVPNSQPHRHYHLLTQLNASTLNQLFPTSQLPTTAVVPKRTLVRFGYKGRRKTVKTILSRFYRLDWGAWIRPRSGRHRKLYRKPANLVRWSRYHVFCNSTQSTMFDKMVAKFWRRRKYYVDDPYETYHSRPDFEITARKGIRYPDKRV